MYIFSGSFKLFKYQLHSFRCLKISKAYTHLQSADTHLSLTTVPSRPINQRFIPKVFLSLSVTRPRSRSFTTFVQLHSFRCKHLQSASLTLAPFSRYSIYLNLRLGIAPSLFKTSKLVTSSAHNRSNRLHLVILYKTKSCLHLFINNCWE